MFPIFIDNEYINSAFNCFISRMDKDVLASFDGFLKEVTLSENGLNKTKYVGVCWYQHTIMSMYDSDIVSIDFIRSQCDELSTEALIGLFAHEFGHLEDRFFDGHNAETYDEDTELTANLIACYWGFKEEIFKMYRELGHSDEEIPFDESEADEEAVRGYWESRAYRVKNRMY
jgi:hypothetical protein